MLICICYVHIIRTIELIVGKKKFESEGTLCNGMNFFPQATAQSELTFQ